MSSGSIIINPKRGGGGSFKVWAAVVSQSGAGTPPAFTVIKNELNTTFISTYLIPGVYALTPIDDVLIQFRDIVLFSANDIIITQGITYMGIVVHPGIDYVGIKTYNMSGALADNICSGFIEIHVFD